MGLITCEEHVRSKECMATFRNIAKENINIDDIFNICCKISKKAEGKTSEGVKQEIDGRIDEEETQQNISTGHQPENQNSHVRIGIIKDSAFQFYYPDNIEALIENGAEIVYISPLTQTIIPDLDAVYMGGGFPETHAPQLAANIEFKSALKELAQKGVPIYAECGGFMFLGKSIEIDQKVYPMADILPVSFGLAKRPVGHGYTSVKVVSDNPFYKKGDVIRGHEFRYSTILDITYQPDEMAFKMERGKGIIDKLDGFCRGNVFATYTHIHTLTTPLWAEGLIKQARKYKQSNK